MRVRRFRLTSAARWVEARPGAIQCAPVPSQRARSARTLITGGGAARRKTREGRGVRAALSYHHTPVQPPCRILPACRTASPLSACQPYILHLTSYTYPARPRATHYHFVSRFYARRKGNGRRARSQPTRLPVASSSSFPRPPSHVPSIHHLSASFCCFIHLSRIISQLLLRSRVCVSGVPAIPPHACHVQVSSGFVNCDSH